MSYRVEFKASWKDIREAAENASLEVAKGIAIDARMIVPVETGKLLSTIEPLKSKYPGGGAIVNAGGGDAFYSTFIELGRPGASARPFLRPALEKNRGRANDVVAEELRKIIGE